MNNDCVRPQKPVLYTFPTDVNLTWLDPQITCRPPVIVSKWNPLWSYWMSERWGIRGKCTSWPLPELCEGSPSTAPRANNMHEYCQTHTHTRKKIHTQSFTLIGLDMPWHSCSHRITAPITAIQFSIPYVSGHVLQYVGRNMEGKNERKVSPSWISHPNIKIKS